MIKFSKKGWFIKWAWGVSLNQGGNPVFVLYWGYPFLMYCSTEKTYMYICKNRTTGKYHITRRAFVK